MIWIIQCLCPNRHAILAIAYDPKKTRHADALITFQEGVKALVAKQTINPWCGICGSTQWTFEQRRSKYKTMEEAKPDMERLEQEQIATRSYIDSLKGSKN